jgi:hypothetical protein
MLGFLGLSSFCIHLQIWLNGSMALRAVDTPAILVVDLTNSHIPRVCLSPVHMSSRNSKHVLHLTAPSCKCSMVPSIPLIQHKWADKINEFKTAIEDYDYPVHHRSLLSVGFVQLHRSQPSDAGSAGVTHLSPPTWKNATTHIANSLFVSDLCYFYIFCCYEDLHL